MLQALSDIRELRNPEKRREREKKEKEEKERREKEEKEQHEQIDLMGKELREKETETEKQEDERLEEEKRMSENVEQDPVSPPVLLPAKDNLTKAQSETSSAEPQTAETRASTVHETGERGAGGDLKKYNLPTYVTVVTVVIKKNLFKTKQFFFFVIL